MDDKTCQRCGGTERITVLALIGASYGNARVGCPDCVRGDPPRATRADIEHVLRNPAACAAVVTRDVLVAWMRAQGWTLTYTAKNGVEVWYLSTKTAEIDRFVPGDHSAWENWPNTVIDALSAGRAAGDRTWWLDLADLWVASGGKR